MAIEVDLIAKGHNSRFAFKKNPDQWGRKAVACGAGDGIQLDTNGLVPTVGMIENDAASGSITRKKGVKGNEIVAADMGPAPLFYRGLELMMALVLGTAGTPTNLGGTAYKHLFRLAQNHKGLFGSFIADYFGTLDGPIWEYPFAKLTGLKIEMEQGKMAKITWPAQAFGINYNIGTPDPVTVVASVQPANGAQTIASQTGKKSKVHVRITDADVSITEYILTFVGKNDDGSTITETYTKSVNGLVWTSTNLFRELTSITGSALAGTAVGDTLEIFTAPNVRRTTPANVTFTIDAQPPEPTQPKITITDANSGITEFVVDFVGTDPDGRSISAQYKLSRDGGPGSHSFTLKERFASFTSIIGSALAGTATAGTDFIQIDNSNGVNNRTTIAAVTEPSDRDLVTWADIEAVLINDETSGALTAATEEAGGVVVDNDEIYPSKLTIDFNLTPTTEDVTTRFRNRIDEPVTAGAGFAECTVTISLSKYSRRDQKLLKAQLSKGTKKMKLALKGPPISGGSGNFFAMDFWFPCMQFADGSPEQDGPGVLPFEIEAKAYGASAVPTGFPSGLSEAIGIDVTTTLSTDPLA